MNVFMDLLVVVFVYGYIGCIEYVDSFFFLIFLLVFLKFKVCDGGR